MMENAARAQKWMLWAAPVMALAGLPGRAGGAAAGLALWMGLGLLLSAGKGRIRLYPKQRRVKLHRLLLGYSFCVSCLAGVDTTGRWLLGGSLSPLPDALLLLGGIGFSLPLGAWAARWPVPRRFSLPASFLFLVLSAYFSNPIQPS